MQYKATIDWKRDTSVPFNAKSYDRTHDIRFNGGSHIRASSAPEFLGKAELPNPEELFISSIASCFMLTFLYWAAVKGLTVNAYTSEAIGTLTKNEEGKMAITEVIIKPTITYDRDQVPDSTLTQELFHKAHDNCFISTSVKTKVTIAG